MIWRLDTKDVLKYISIMITNTYVDRDFNCKTIMFEFYDLY